MVFAFYCNESGRAPQQLQCGEHLNALSDRHVGIGCAVKKQQRRMDFVGIEEWTMVYIEIFARPGITPGHTYLAVRVTPIALAPITGVVADACVRDGGSEDVGLGL